MKFRCHVLLSSALLTCCLTCLTDDLLVRVLHALALVWLRRTDRADLCCDRTNELLVDSGNSDLCRSRYVDRDLSRHDERDRVRVAKCELHPFGLLLSLETDADEFELLCKAVRYAFDHIVHKRARETMQ